jgi:hypothetical protein
MQLFSKPRPLKSALSSIALLGALIAGADRVGAQTQPQPFMFIDAASVFEGSPGSPATLRIPVRFDIVPTAPVSGTVQIFSRGATIGPSCGVGVDIRSPLTVPFAFPAGAAPGTTFLNFEVCPDSLPEGDESIIVVVASAVGIANFGEPDTAIGTIIDDDGPPAITIKDISVSTLEGLSKTVRFPVTLHHPSPTPVTLNFATRDSLLSRLVYFPTRGTVTFPPGVLTTNIPVTITGDYESSFTMDLLSSSQNSRIIDSSVACTIKFLQLIFQVGTWDVSPANASVKVDEEVNYSVTWTLPESKVWRDIHSFELRLRKGNEIALWLTWDEAANTFSICEPTRKKTKKGQIIETLDCTAGALPGTPTVLATALAQLNLANTSLIGSGPVGRTFTLNLPLTFLGDANGTYQVEVAATDDTGNQDEFTEATTIHVKKK